MAKKFEVDEEGMDIGDCMGTKAKGEFGTGPDCGEVKLRAKGLVDWRLIGDVSCDSEKDGTDEVVAWVMIDCRKGFVDCCCCAAIGCC